MKKKLSILVVCIILAAAIPIFVQREYQAKKHEEYMYRWGWQIVRYLSSMDTYPKNLQEYIIWDEMVTSAGDPNEEIKACLQQCVCPLTNHEPKSFEDVDNWADIKIVPYLRTGVDRGGEMMLAYCPAANHGNNKNYAVFHLSLDRRAPTWRHYYLVKEMSQEEFEERLEVQRIAFEAGRQP